MAEGLWDFPWIIGKRADWLAVRVLDGFFGAGLCMLNGVIAVSRRLSPGLSGSVRIGWQCGF